MTDPTLIADMVRAGVDPALIQRVALLRAHAEINARGIEERRAKDVERARFRALNGAVSPELRNFILKRDGFVCVYCGEMEGTPQIDHIVPLSRGGETTPDNLTVACRSCNSSKGARTPEEWRTK